jgi:translation initiation factor IF-2
MAKMRVYDLAKELQVQPKELLELLQTIGVTGKVPSSSIEDTAARSLRQMIENKNNPQPVQDAAPAPTTPAGFQNFRSGGRRSSGSVEGVSSDVIEDYREQIAPDENIITQGPAKSGPGARRDAPAPRSADTRPAPTPAPTPPPVPPAPAAPVAASNGNANGSTANRGAAANPGAIGPHMVVPPTTGSFAQTSPPAGAPGAAPANAPQFQTRGRFGRGNRRDFRNRRDRTGEGPRFGDRDFQADSEQSQDKAGAGKTISLPPEITIAELAAKLDQPVSALIKSCLR